MTTDKPKRDPHNDIYGPGDDNYGRDKWNQDPKEYIKMTSKQMTTDNLAGKILREELIISDEYWIEYINNLLYNYKNDSITKKKVIKILLSIKNEAMQAYREAKMKDELIAFKEFMNTRGYPFVCMKSDIDDYIKYRNK